MQGKKTPITNSNKNCLSYNNKNIFHWITNVENRKLLSSLYIGLNKAYIN